MPHLKPGEEGLICVSFIVEDPNCILFTSTPYTVSSHWMLHHKGIPFGQRLVCQVTIDTESNCYLDSQKSQSKCKGSTPDLFWLPTSKGSSKGSEITETKDWLSDSRKDPSSQTDLNPIPLPYIPLSATNAKSVGTNEAIDLSASSSVSHMKSSRANQYPLLPNYGSVFLPAEKNKPVDRFGVKETEEVSQLMKDYEDMLLHDPFSERGSSPEPDDFVILPYPEYSRQPGECSSSSSLEVIPDEAATQSSMEPQPSQASNVVNTASSKEEKEINSPSLSKALNKSLESSNLAQESSEPSIDDEKNATSSEIKSKAVKTDSNDNRSKQSEAMYNALLTDLFTLDHSASPGVVLDDSNGHISANSEPATVPSIPAESIQPNSNIQSSPANPSSLWSNAGQFVENVKRNLLPPSNLVSQVSQ